MSDSVVQQLGDGEGSFLATLELRRRADGRIVAVLQDMPDHEIDNEATISLRFTKAAMWTMEGAIDLMRQAVRFDDETQAENDHG